jgi:hypothetical protein
VEVDASQLGVVVEHLFKVEYAMYKPVPVA